LLKTCDCLKYVLLAAEYRRVCLFSYVTFLLLLFLTESFTDQLSTGLFNQARFKLITFFLN